jgi:hypothetical protein
MLERIKKHIINIPGKRLDRKLLVLESDDWGSIRIPDLAAKNRLMDLGLLSVHDPFSKFDTLESADDLEALFSVLNQFNDEKGNSPVITANIVVGNPDFQKIKYSDFSEYYFEAFTQTYQNLSVGVDPFSVMQKGIDEGLFFPQYHAREHLNVSTWMQLLQSGDEAFRKAFESGCFSIDYKARGNRRNNLMAAYDYNTVEDLSFIRRSISEGLALFEQHFQFKSITTIAPCYVWDAAIEDIFLENGVAVFQGSRFQNTPQPNSSDFKKIFHYNGEKVKEKVYLSRNGLFEPSINQNIHWVDKAMESIATAFAWNKPAVIGTHRLNYVGSLVPENRDRNLRTLAQLLTQVLQKWPDVEFVNSAELADLYQ